jgi:crotonobetainyl-CoA:carnitine CoA-transferase CaiB-like acyl-CoA transferase
VILSDIRVISLTHFLQGPAGVQMLADLGADVVKVEPPGRGAWERSWSGAQTYLNGESIFFLLANRNQRSLTLNLKSNEGKEIFWRLIERSDVLVENYRPGTIDRLGFGYEAAARVNPKIVYCSCSGYGIGGPYRDLPGQDLLAQALTGLASLTGSADAPPTPVGSAVVDQHAAALLVIGVLAALRGRDRTGAGCRVDVNLLSAGLDLLVEPITYYINNAPLKGRSRAAIADVFHEAPYGIYPTQDGWIAISMSHLGPLADATGSAELSRFRDDERYERRDEISSVISHVCRSRTTAEWLGVFQAAGIWCAPVHGLAQVATDPQVLWNESFITFEHPRAGRVRVLAHPIRYDGAAPRLRRRPPLVGEHNEEILAELGYSSDVIAQLRTDGVI